MGRGPAPVQYVPTPTAPVIYQSVIPEEDFERAEAYFNELKGQRAEKQRQLEEEGFGSSAMAERQKSYLKAEQDAYRRSMPGAPKGFGGRREVTTPGFPSDREREVTIPGFPSDREREVTTQGRGFGFGRVMPAVMKSLMEKSKSRRKRTGIET
tara:strand:+ start:88 stop:549 length:462 start_codon:yes stop_codon:yes gene_type:complete